MRSELGKLSLDEVLRERDALNTTIAASINEASADWWVGPEHDTTTQPFLRNKGGPSGAKPALSRARAAPAGAFSA